MAYTLYPVKEDDDDIWEIRTFVTTGVAGLKHTDYNVGFYWYPTTKYAVPILGIGFRDSEFHTKSLGSYRGAYVSLGFRL